MDIVKLKNMVENKSLSDMLLVFICDNEFLYNQYISEIAKFKNLQINYITSLDDSNDLFNVTANHVLDIYKVNKLKCDSDKILTRKNLIIIAKEFEDSTTEQIFDRVTVRFPKLEDWCVKDYLYSNLPSLDNNQKDWLFDICKHDIYRVKQEIDRLNIFKQNQQKQLFEQFKCDNIYEDLIEFSIFEFTNAIIKKDIPKLSKILEHLKNCDIEPLGVVTVLFKNFRNIILVQLSNNATPQSTGLTPAQFSAIRYNCLNYYDNDNLIEIFEFITEIEEKLKNGSLPQEYILDYILVNILI